mmetsp:Transcript_19237/g.36855  ORF Transcript_19237/g.36855 Transcript_19237/m.36855 type:complete len:529 (-) Transcript_19237:264-1850(-)
MSNPFAPEEPEPEALAPKDGVLKYTLRPGTGRLHPIRGDQVDLIYTIKIPRGQPNAGKELEHKSLNRYAIGSGQVCPGLDVLLGSMIEGERSSARLKKAYAAADASRELLVELLLVHKDQVIVPGEVVRKRVYRAAPSFAADSPPYVADWAQVRADVGLAECKDAPTTSVDFMVGDGSVPEGIEKGLVDLTAGEVVELQMSPEYCEAGVDNNPLADLITLDSTESHAVLRVTIVRVSLPAALEPEALMRLAANLKEQGTRALKATRTRRAWERYKMGCQLLQANSQDLQDRADFAASLAALLLNRSLAAAKCNLHQDAETACSQVLECSSENVKALFRRGQARVSLGKWTEARADLTRARSLDKGVDADVRKELHRLKSLESQRKQHETKFFKSMFAESEIYSESERAPQGLAFPCKKDLVPIDLQEIYDEIEEEEEQEETMALAKAAMEKGRRAQSLAPVNPWDRSGKKQEMEQHNSMIAEMTQAGKEKDAKHYESGRWMKNHPHHHEEWIQKRKVKEEKGSSDDES